jgi:hypothetical protein
VHAANKSPESLSTLEADLNAQLGTFSEPRRRQAQLIRTCEDGSVPKFRDEDVGAEFEDNKTFGIVVASFFLLLLAASVVVFCGIAYKACTAQGQKHVVGMSDIDTVRTVPTVRVHS